MRDRKPLETGEGVRSYSWSGNSKPSKELQAVRAIGRGDRIGSTGKLVLRRKMLLPQLKKKEGHPG